MASHISIPYKPPWPSSSTAIAEDETVLRFLHTPSPAEYCFDSEIRNEEERRSVRENLRLQEIHSQRHRNSGQALQTNLQRVEKKGETAADPNARPASLVTQPNFVKLTENEMVQSLRHWKSCLKDNLTHSVPIKEADVYAVHPAELVSGASTHYFFSNTKYSALRRPTRLRITDNGCRWKQQGRIFPITERGEKIAYKTYLSYVALKNGNVLGSSPRAPGHAKSSRTVPEKLVGASCSSKGKDRNWSVWTMEEIGLKDDIEDERKLLKLGKKPQPFPVICRIVCKREAKLMTLPLATTRLKRSRVPIRPYPRRILPKPDMQRFPVAVGHGGGRPITIAEPVTTVVAPTRGVPSQDLKHTSERGFGKSEEAAQDWAPGGAHATISHGGVGGSVMHDVPVYFALAFPFGGGAGSAFEEVANYGHPRSTWGTHSFGGGVGSAFEEVANYGHPGSGGGTHSFRGGASFTFEGVPMYGHPGSGGGTHLYEGGAGSTFEGVPMYGHSGTGGGTHPFGGGAGSTFEGVPMYDHSDHESDAAAPSVGGGAGSTFGVPLALVCGNLGASGSTPSYFSGSPFGGPPMYGDPGTSASAPSSPYFGGACSSFGVAPASGDPGTSGGAPSFFGGDGSAFASKVVPNYAHPGPSWGTGTPCFIDAACAAFGCAPVYDHPTASGRPSSGIEAACVSFESTAMYDHLESSRSGTPTTHATRAAFEGLARYGHQLFTENDSSLAEGAGYPFGGLAMHGHQVNMEHSASTFQSNPTYTYGVPLCTEGVVHAFDALNSDGGVAMEDFSQKTESLEMQLAAVGVAAAAFSDEGSCSSTQMAVEDIPTALVEHVCSLYQKYGFVKDERIPHGRYFPETEFDIGEEMEEGLEDSAQDVSENHYQDEKGKGILE